jgi:hypothetical protein
VLERLVRRMERHLRWSGLLRAFEDEAEPDGEGDPEGNLVASAVSGRAPRAGVRRIWKSRVLRRQVLGEEDEGGRRGSGADEVA